MGATPPTVYANSFEISLVFWLWSEGMDMLWIKFLSFVSVFCSANLGVP